MDDKIKRMKELIPILSEAAKAYYHMTGFTTSS